MPNVDGRSFGYKKADIKKAKAYTKITGKKVTKKRKSKKA